MICRLIQFYIKEKAMLIIVLLVIFALCYVVFYNGLTLRKYKIDTNKLGDGNSLRAVLITDLHSKSYGKNFNKLLSKVKEQKPDIILLAGDIIDKRKALDKMEPFFKSVSEIAPAYYVTGNHECTYKKYDIEELKSMIRNQGVTVLEHDYTETVINNIPVIIAGIDDPYLAAVQSSLSKPVTAKPMHEAFNELKDKKPFKILLAHRPENIEKYKSYSFDMVVSGHAHGGQVRIPFLVNGLYAPHQGFFPKYAGGLYKHEGLTHIVSRGLSSKFLIPRVFNPPEVVVIDVGG